MIILLNIYNLGSHFGFINLKGGIIIFLFRKKRRSHRRIYLFSIGFFIIGILITYKYQYILNNFIPSLSIFENTKTDILTEETIVNEVRSVNKIIPLEVELSETITLDNSFGDLEVFKKSKKLIFFATCSYSMDLSKLSKSDIILDKVNNEITISLPDPEVFSINIDENKTIYNEPDIGLLRFGDIQISTEKIGYIRNNLNESFKNKMNDEILRKEAINNTVIILQNLINNLTDQSYKINIVTE